MAGRIVCNNTAYLRRERGKPNLTDAKWRSLKTICQMAQLLHWTVMTSYFYQHDYPHLNLDNLPARPHVLTVLDLSAIILLATVNILRTVVYFCGKNHLFWIVRDNDSAAEHDGETHGWFEPFVRLFAELHADTAQLASRLDNRRGSSATPSWLGAHSSPTAAGRTITRVLHRAEVMEHSLQILAHPKTMCVDSHTLLHVNLAKNYAAQENEALVLTSDLRQPLRKHRLKTLRGPAAGIEFAYPDEDIAGTNDQVCNCR
jgi:hypothetical protein